MGKSLDVRRDTWCRHRTPFTNEFKECKVGVDFHPWRATGDWKTGMPCLGESPEAIAKCSKYEAWTDEELAAREAEIDGLIKRMGKIRAAIIASIENTGQWSGAIPCPSCATGTVKYSRAHSNGHVHARCSTEGCASWME